MTKLAINGAAGRMGLRLIELGLKNPELNILAGLEHDSHPKLGTDIGLLVGSEEIGIEVSASTDEPIDVVIDFSSPLGAESIISFCHEKQIGLVMATTGLEAAAIQKLEEASHKIPIVWAPNMSMAVNLTMKLAETAGKALKNHSSGVDVEVIERHHRFKADSPSGTALKFGELISSAMGQTSHRHGREGQVGERPVSEIGYHAIRAGDDPGQHTIVFGMMGEIIELRVAATSRDCYAQGALEAASFLVHQGPGLYSMYDVLGLN